jgi:hypothetical protein
VAIRHSLSAGTHVIHLSGIVSLSEQPRGDSEFLEYHRNAKRVRSGQYRPFSGPPLLRVHGHKQRAGGDRVVLGFRTNRVEQTSDSHRRHRWKTEVLPLTPNLPQPSDRLIRAIVTFATLGVALFYILFRPQSPITNQWAFAMVMLVAAYWLPRGAGST